MANRKVVKRAVKKPASKAAKRTAPQPRHEATQGLYSWITHTEFASRDPDATKAWAAKALGWTMTQTVDGPGGAYHLFAFSEQGGGGIRGLEPGENPHTTPTVHVEDCQKAFAKAVRAGAQPIMAPMTIMPGVVIATVREPGGNLIGLSGGK